MSVLPATGLLEPAVLFSVTSGMVMGQYIKLFARLCCSSKHHTVSWHSKPSTERRHISPHLSAFLRSFLAQVYATLRTAQPTTHNPQQHTYKATMPSQSSSRLYSRPTHPIPPPKKHVHFAPSAKAGSISTAKPETWRSVTRQPTSTAKPILVAAGLGAIGRAMEAKKESKQSVPRRQSYLQVRPAKPPPAPVKRRHESSPSSKPSNSRPTKAARTDSVEYGWTRVTRRTTRVWL